MWSTTPLFVLLVALGAIDAAPQPASFESSHNPYADVVAVMGPKPSRNFGVFHFGGDFGVAKRLSPASSKYDTKTEKYRRGPLNGLIPGGAFGRAARSNCIRYDCRSPTYDRFIKILKEKNRRYFPFELVENRNDSEAGTLKDGPEKIPTRIDVYTPYQYQQLSASNKYI